ncbi:MAG: DUF2180 family protein [Armatimonadetes bacterium]|nr:DUF2180 family protein [Armatimonadota bacterium]
MTAPIKVAVLPCNRIARLATRIARQSAYRARDLRPDHILVVDIGRLTPEQAAIDILRRFPVVVIDGCRPKGAVAMVAGGPIRPAAVIYVADFTPAGKPWGPREAKHRGLTPNGFNLIDTVAQAAVFQVDMVMAKYGNLFQDAGQETHAFCAADSIPARYDWLESLPYPDERREKGLLCCECAISGDSSQAIAICVRCGMGMCVKHLIRDEDTLPESLPGVRRPARGKSVCVCRECYSLPGQKAKSFSPKARIM